MSSQQTSLGTFDEPSKANERPEGRDRRKATQDDETSTDDKKAHAVSFPRNGLARALWDADPDTPVRELGKVLHTVDRWECTGCGALKLGVPQTCVECGAKEFDKIPGEEREENE